MLLMCFSRLIVVKYDSQVAGIITWVDNTVILFLMKGWDFVPCPLWTQSKLFDLSWFNFRKCAVLHILISRMQFETALQAEIKDEGPKVWNQSWSGCHRHTDGNPGYVIWWYRQKALWTSQTEWDPNRSFRNPVLKFYLLWGCSIYTHRLVSVLHIKFDPL